MSAIFILVCKRVRMRRDTFVVSIATRQQMAAEDKSEDKSEPFIKKAETIDKEEFVGNVSQYIPLPEGYRGSISKGNLIFDACFEGGELVPAALKYCRFFGYR